MSTPAVVQGDRIMGTCPGHLIPSASGTQPAGPMPFSAPLTMGLEASVLINGKPVAVVGSSGYNTPAHVGLADAFTSPTMQEGRVVAGSTSVLFGGKPAARTGCSVMMCAGVPGQVVGSEPTVMIGA